MTTRHVDMLRPGRAAVTIVSIFTTLSCGCSRAPQVYFALEPSVVSACVQPVPTRVRWDVTPLGLEYAEIEVHDLGRQPKLWVVGVAKGEAIADAWANDGYTVLLKSRNGVVLAKRTMTTTPCPGKDWL